uniref:BLTX740 n=1 Tax=Nephila pilipes TaxID=299642 RepID=A0A076KUQ5_NEPPI|nr:BLTX740 [Nephila pilipes]
MTIIQSEEKDDQKYFY